MDNRLPVLSELSDWELVNSEQDVRGRPLMLATGERLGIIRRMLVDRDNERVAALVLDNGRAIPVEDVEIRDGDVYVETATDLPAETYPPASDAAVIPVVAEEIAIGTRTVERGRINVRTRTVETPVHEDVRLREERVDIARRAVDEPVTDADALFRERSIDLVETGEEAVVAKQARVVEEIIVSTDVDERIETVDDTVRRTEVDVERVPSDHSGQRRGV